MRVSIALKKEAGWLPWFPHGSTPDDVTGYLYAVEQYMYGRPLHAWRAVRYGWDEVGSGHGNWLENDEEQTDTVEEAKAARERMIDRDRRAMGMIPFEEALEKEAAVEYELLPEWEARVGVGSLCTIVDILESTELPGGGYVRAEEYACVDNLGLGRDRYYRVVQYAIDELVDHSNRTFSKEEAVAMVKAWVAEELQREGLRPFNEVVDEA
jgi:hypothetical protein